MPAMKQRNRPKKTIPDEAAVLADFSRAYDLLDRGALDTYGGQFVAVLQGQVVGADPDPAALREAVSEKHRIDPERMAIIQVVDKIVVL
jgi:hypothetical protein